MEGFNEQVVKRDKTAKNLVIKIIAVVLLFVIPLTFVLLARLINFYLALVGFFLFIGGIYVVWWVFSQQKVEYEYSTVTDTLKIAKIISLRKRKKVCNVPIREITQLEVGDQNIRTQHFRKMYFAAKNPNDTGTNTYAVFNDQVYGKCLLVFNPNENILEGMKPYLDKTIMIQFFYKKRDAHETNG